MKPIFVVGTDTDAGKTHCTELLLKALKQENKKVLGLKPIASGAEHHHHQLKNQDALKLMHASSKQLPYHLHNPFVFQEPIAPNIAAQKENRVLSVDNVIEAMKPALSEEADFLFIEGAGGLLCPLNDHELFSDLIFTLNFPAILVVNLKLGAINHALLTEDAMNKRKIKCLGWVGNSTAPETEYTQQMENDLKQRLSFPHLLTVKFNQNELDDKIRKHLLTFI